MLQLGALGFTSPFLLLALLALPLLWVILRAVPPAPIRRKFPGVALLLGLADDEVQSDRTPWWLLLLRMAAVALVILGFAGPVLNPQQSQPGTGPLLIVLDGTWADARDWPRRMERVEAALTEAGREGRPVALAVLTDLPTEDLPFQSAETWLSGLPGLKPNPWLPQAEDLARFSEMLAGQRFDTFWLSDGLDHSNRPDGADHAALLAQFEAAGQVRIFESPRPVQGLTPARFEEGDIALTALRSWPGPNDMVTVIGRGTDPNGIERVLVREELRFEGGALAADLALSLPAELRNRLTRFEIEAERSAAAVSLTDDSLRRREVALFAGRASDEAFELLSPLHYLEQALAPTADLLQGSMVDVLQANPDVIIFADVARLAEAEEQALAEWVEAGGLLLRFAGPRLAASDVSRDALDPLMPVRLRVGGRSVGGAMSWGAPKSLQPFAEESPFYGLPVPSDVHVTAQVLAQPDPELAERTIAALTDGTPLITRRMLGEGQVVLVHVTANAEWSSLPLSGLFVQLLERLAISTRPTSPTAAQLQGTVWQLEETLDAFGRLTEAGIMGGIDGPVLAQPVLGPDLPPGLYAGEDLRIALNVLGAEDSLTPTRWPDRIAVEGMEVAKETLLKGFFLSFALLLLFADLLASLWLSGKLSLRRRSGPVMAGALLLGLVALHVTPSPVQAQTDQEALDLALAATAEVVLAHVITGDPGLDDVARAGLNGLSDVLYARTSIEPAAPLGVDLERDELSFFPFLYWPISADQPLPSSEAYGKLNRYLRKGGMILFDTRDADIGGLSGGSAESRRLQAIARGLDIPPLEPIPEDHVLTRTFYLLQDFPGRYNSRQVWVEAAPSDAEQVDGVPFRNLNDGVTPVVIGGNDWASAWATMDGRSPMFQVGRGYAGERQREIAYRFGVNLVMHVLTGNYKSDQVHVPALLDRLGQ